MTETFYSSASPVSLATPLDDEVFLVVGGVMTSVRVVGEAHDILTESPGLMVRQPLARYRNPLALCDYHAEARPYRDGYYATLTFKGKGAAGRPATKTAFMHALRIRSAQAMADAPLVAAMPLAAEAYEAMRTDVSYVMAMAKMAVQVLARQHTWRLRSELKQAQQEAVAQCAAHDGAFVCDNDTACGTGACRFAGGIYRKISAPAAKGRTARPSNHGGGPFSSDGALEQLERLRPFKVPRLL